MTGGRHARDGRLAGLIEELTDCIRDGGVSQSRSPSPSIVTADTLQPAWEWSRRMRTFSRRWNQQYSEQYT
ncbi:hypothetical protein ACN28S_53635 [Cystobacter fuscus]